MNSYIVLYMTSYSSVTDPPFGFQCYAEDTDHAEEQCLNAHSDCDIVWVCEGDSYKDALDDYWNVSDINLE